MGASLKRQSGWQGRLAVGIQRPQPSFFIKEETLICIIPWLKAVNIRTNPAFRMSGAMQ